MRQSDIDREAQTAALLAIAASHGNVLSPTAVVDAARDPRHILHSEFEWDDGEAGELYRLLQASALIRRVKVHVVVRDRQTGKVNLRITRAMQSRPSMRSRDKGYETIENIMADHAKREELIAQVLRELQSYRKRYASLTEIADVWAAIDDALEHREASRQHGTADQPSA